METLKIWLFLTNQIFKQMYFGKACQILVHEELLLSKRGYLAFQVEKRVVIVICEGIVALRLSKERDHTSRANE